MKSIFCSWSGGKDSCLALYHAVNKGYKPGELLTMLTEGKEKSRSHGLSVEVLKKQADSLKIPLLTCPTTWNEYKDNFVNMLKQIKEDDINIGVFGDIDIEEHKEWVTGVCSEVGMKAILPLWNKTRQELLSDFIDSGFKAVIVVVKEEELSGEYLGKVITRDLVSEFADIGIDPSGENGEYHTVVIDGPIFSFPLSITKGNISSHKGYSFMDIKVT